MPIGFIGLGNIGGRVTPHLLAAGHELIVSDLDASAVESLVAQGATSASTPAEVAGRAEVIALSLPAPSIVAAVVDGEQGILRTAARGTIIVDHSTIDPGTARDLAERAAAHGVIYLDAPVSGGVQAADAGTLSVIIGGDPQAAEAVRETISAYAANIFHVGESGSGQAIKLANNVITAANIVALGEALSHLVKNGVDLTTAVQVLSTSSANSTVLSSYFPRTLFTAERPTGFALDFMLKDINLFQADASGSGIPTPVLNIVADLFRIGQRDGNGAKDFTSVVEFYEDFLGERLQTAGDQS